MEELKFFVMTSAKSPHRLAIPTYSHIMDAGLGVEPKALGYEPNMLPLHYPAISGALERT